MSRFGYIRHGDGIERHVIKLPQLGDVFVYTVADASFAERALMVLFASGGRVAKGETFASRCIVDTTQRVGYHSVNGLQAVYKLLFATALESVKEKSL